MKVLSLIDRKEMKPSVYTSNVYFVLGSSNAMEDVNTLVDVGMDPLVLERIDHASTGVGKKRVAQVVLTHNHFDHAGLLPQIRERFGPIVYAFSPMEGVDELLRHRQVLRMGDRDFEVLHTPGHSHDSVCLYCKDEAVLFYGDTSLVIRTTSGSYEEEYVHALEQLATLRVETAYGGHGEPLTGNIREKIRDTLANVRKARQKQQISVCGADALSNAGFSDQVGRATH